MHFDLTAIDLQLMHVAKPSLTELTSVPLASDRVDLGDQRTVTSQQIGGVCSNHNDRPFTKSEPIQFERSIIQSLVMRLFIYRI